MRKHVQVLGILNIVWGALGLLGALVVLLVFGGAATLVGVIGRQAPEAHIAIPILTLIGGFVFTLLLLTSAPAVIVGVALLREASWARIAGIVLSAIHLLSVPFGTALGVYGLWVLISDHRLSQPQSGPVRL